MVDDETSEYKGDTGIDLLEMELFLDRIDGNKELAAKLIGIFLKHFMEKQAAVKKAVENKDPEALKASAHALKGMLCHFCKQAADLTYQLENMGSSDKIDITKANAVYGTLKLVINQIVPKLEEYQRRFKVQEQNPMK